MLSFLLPLAAKIIHDAVQKIPNNQALGELLVKICLEILEKAVKSTETTMDDQLLATVKAALLAREPDRTDDPTPETEAEGGE